MGPELEDDLANGESARQDINLKKMAADITLEFHDLFMKYLPRICNHCLNPACVAACPSGAIYKREEDGVVLVSQDGCRGWRHCVPACPYKKVFFNWKTNKAEKCIFCEARLAEGQAAGMRREPARAVRATFGDPGRPGEPGVEVHAGDEAVLRVDETSFYYRPMDGMPLDALPSNAPASSKQGKVGV